MSNSRGSPSSHPPACCWGLIWSEQVLYIGVSVTWHSWFVPRNKESNCKVMKLSLTCCLSKNTYTKMLHTNCHYCLKYQSHELFDMYTIEWFLALFTLNNGYLILVDRFTFENYMQLENGVMWHTCNLSLWPHRCLTRKPCCVRSLPVTAWPGLKEMCLLLCSHTLEVIITSPPILGERINLWASAAGRQLNHQTIFGPEPFLYRIHFKQSQEGT